MKIKQLSANIMIYGILSLMLFSCNLTKKVPDGEYLLTKNQFIFKSKEKPLKGKLENYVKQKPTGSFKLWASNRVSKKLDLVFDQYYRLLENERNASVLDSLLKMNGLDQYVGKSLWLKRQFYQMGARPVILDTIIAQNNTKTLKNFYAQNGYFNAETEVNFKFKDNKKAEAIFSVNPGRQSRVIEFSYDIEDQTLRNIYEDNISQAVEITGKPYAFENLEKERNRINTLYRNNGYYRFNNEGNAILFEVDSTNKYQLSVQMKIPTPRDSEGNLQDYKQFTVKEVNIITDEKVNLQFINHYGYTIFNGIKSYKPDYFTNMMAVEPGKLYRKMDEINARKNILFRENMDLTDLNYTLLDESDTLLAANVYLKPREKLEPKFSLETHYSEYLSIGVAPSAELLVRNVFGGGENLRFKVGGAFGTVADQNEDSNFLNAWELNGDVTLSVPYFLIPFKKNKPLQNKNLNPETNINLGFNNQKNIGIGRTSTYANFSYLIRPKRNITHELMVIGSQFVNNRDKNNYYNIFADDGIIRDVTYDLYFNYDPTAEDLLLNGVLTEDELAQIIIQDNGFIATIDNAIYENFTNMYFRRFSITQDYIINSTAYNFTFNQLLEGKLNPWWIRAGVEVAGSLESLFSTFVDFSTIDDIDGTPQRTIFNIPYSQFVKFDVDVRKRIRLGEKSELAFRNFIGVAVPFGNTNVIPFPKTYFAGGSNDVRAWVAYNLTSNPPSTSEDQFYIDNLKLLWSTEYRFNIWGYFDGALFADAGNIWSVARGLESESEFRFDRFFQQIGIGAGFGVRLNLQFLIIRADFAYKIHDPAYEGSEKWRWSNFDPLEPRFNFGIGYPF